ncbi:unnamed protein product [Effrenium voratum]|uniref:Uncharacterized protein n=1 Tax=Effrenium voratum TaxID=2562239 RepID=A0AA36JSU5_9DINO|nr:unnamed protein product [Effrenium voratum]
MCFLCSQAFGVDWKGSLGFSCRGVRFQIVLGVSHLGLACSAGRLSQPSDIMLFFILPLVWLGAAKECQSDEQSAAVFEALSSIYQETLDVAEEDRSLVDHGIEKLYFEHESKCSQLATLLRKHRRHFGLVLHLFHESFLVDGFKKEFEALNVAVETIRVGRFTRAKDKQSKGLCVLSAACLGAAAERSIVSPLSMQNGLHGASLWALSGVFAIL